MTTPRALSDDELNDYLYRAGLHDSNTRAMLSMHISFLTARIEDLEKDLAIWKGLYESQHSAKKLREATVVCPSLSGDPDFDFRHTLKSENEKLKAVCENKTILLRAVRYSMDREVPFPSLEKITDAINDGTNGYETELSTLRQLCGELADALTNQMYRCNCGGGGRGGKHSDSCSTTLRTKALAKYNSTKGD